MELPELPPSIYTPVIGTLVTAIGILINWVRNLYNKVDDLHESKLDLLQKEAKSSYEMAVAILKEREYKEIIKDKVNTILKEVQAIKLLKS